jgi:hypothetical protein
MLNRLLLYIKNFKGLLKKKKEYHFLNIPDLVHFFISIFYKEKIIVVIYDCKNVFDEIAKLSILKRDNFQAYQLGLESDIVLIEFNSLVRAEDWTFSIGNKNKWEIFNNNIKVKDNTNIKESITKGIDL